jgi:hypothetical protein
MRITHDGKVERTDMWREGKWLDLWSAVHFLSGVSVGLGFYYLHLGAVASVALAFVCLTAYEMWEMIVKIEETPTNRVMDVVVGMASFVPTFFVLGPLVSSALFIPAFCGVLLLNIILSIFGWRASQKAAAFEKRMRERYAAQRQRLLERQLLLRKRFRR